VAIFVAAIDLAILSSADHRTVLSVWTAALCCWQSMPLTTVQ